MGAETANTLCSILRGTTANQFGDEIDSDIPVMEHLPVTLIETGHTTQDPSSPTPRTIREIKCIVPHWAPLTDSDRIRDERTGDVYMVISVTRPPTIIGAPVDTVAILKRVSAQAA